jgi:glycosyltransferase involved in cell wall biosynthesis
MQADIAVVIPVYNGALYLPECIGSVCAQTLPPGEIIVIDDGSEDETAAVAASWGDRIRYCRFPHGGLPLARNRAIAEATAGTIAFIDADDVWLPEKLELQMAALEQATEPTMVFSMIEQFISPDLPPDEAARLRLDPRPFTGVAASTLLMRREHCLTAGSFDESLATGEFIEWHARASDAGIRSLTLDQTLARRRLHRSNMGRGQAATKADYVRMLKKVLDRRRSAT